MGVSHMRTRKVHCNIGADTLRTYAGILDLTFARAAELQDA